MDQPPKRPSEMTQDELREESKRLSAKIKLLQLRKAEVEEAYTAAQESEKAVAAVRQLSPVRRAALLRALETQAAAELAAEGDAKRAVEEVAAAVQDPAPVPPPPPPPDPLKLTDAQKSAAIREAELKAAKPKK